MLPEPSSANPDDAARRVGAIRTSLPARLLIAILALGLLIGYGMGWIAFGGPLSGGSAATVLYDEDLVKSIFEKASSAVVEVEVFTPRSQRGPSGSQRAVVGSGFLVDDAGHIVTNHHVVDNAVRITVRLHDGREIPATKLGTSPADDLALLQVDPDAVANIEPLPLADAGNVEPGQLAIAIGSPFEELNSVSVGVVSGIGRSRRSVINRPIPDLVQTDAALNPGNSGGPLLNSKGEVIGVNSSVQVVSSMQVGIGFAISTKTLRSVLPALIRSEDVKRPWIGIAGEMLTRDHANFLGLTTFKGVYVTRVCPGSPAEAARLQGAEQFARAGMGDTITEVDGRPIESVGDMVSYFNELRPGDSVTLTVVRRGTEYGVDVTLDEWMACQ